MTKNNSAVGQLNPEQCVRKTLGHFPIYLNASLMRHKQQKFPITPMGLITYGHCTLYTLSGQQPHFTRGVAGQTGDINGNFMGTIRERFRSG